MSNSSVVVSPRHVGVFGASLDPPHVGHVLAVTWSLLVGDFDHIVVVPTFQHPFAKVMVPFEHRLAMTEVAFRDLRRVVISDIERQLGGTSYTHRTLRALTDEYKRARFSLIVGSDAADDLPNWSHHDQIQALADIFPVPRSGYESATGFAICEVSSSDVRRRLAEADSTAGLLPDAVEAYCRKQALYAPAASK